MLSDSPEESTQLFVTFHNSLVPQRLCDPSNVFFQKYAAHSQVFYQIHESLVRYTVNLAHGAHRMPQIMLRPFKTDSQKKKRGTSSKSIPRERWGAYVYFKNLRRVGLGHDIPEQPVFLSNKCYTSFW